MILGQKAGAVRLKNGEEVRRAMSERFVALMMALTLVGCMGSTEDFHPIEFDGTEYRNPVMAPDFNLTDQNGDSVSLSDFEGKVVVVAFTYTHCPDVCLAVENNLDHVHENLGDLSDDVVLISITIDPARDTVERYANWTTQNGFDWPHLTHSNHMDLAQVWEDWNIVVDNDHIYSDHSNHGSHTSSGEMEHRLGVVFPDNTTVMHTATYAMDMETTYALNHSMNAFMQNNVSHSMDNGTVISIAGVASAYELYMWHEMEGGSHWMKSMKNATTSILMQDSNHYAWVAEGANASLLMDPTMNHSSNSSDDSGHMDHGDQGSDHSDHGEEEEYLVGHSTVTFIIDESGHKRVAWTGSDWDATLFLSDLQKLVGEGGSDHSHDHSH